MTKNYEEDEDESTEAVEQRKKAKLVRAQELDDIKAIISRPEGLRFFRRLLSEGRVFHTTFTGNSNGYFLEGQRNLALKFFDDVVQAAPSKIAELVIEQKD